MIIINCNIINGLQNLITSSTFWTAISAIATFVMAYFTYKTLMQNKEQLEDIKTQRFEDTRARIICSFVHWNHTYLLKVENIGKEPAYNMLIKVTGKPIANHLFETIKTVLDELANKKITLPAGRSNYYMICPSHFTQGYAGVPSIETYTYSEILKWLGEYENEPINIRIEYNDKYVFEDTQSLNNYFTKGLVIVPDNMEEIAKSLNEINHTIKSKWIN